MEAKTSLGDMFFHGMGVEKDLLVADAWLGEAASAGSIDACHLLGRLLVRTKMPLSQVVHSKPVRLIGLLFHL